MRGQSARRHGFPCAQLCVDRRSGIGRGATGAAAYARSSSGGLKLLGVEYFRAVLLRNVVTGETGPRFESEKWDPAQYELVTPQPQLLGQGFELDPPPAPGVPWHWSLHVWIWADNPSGMFSPWNPSISCD